MAASAAATPPIGSFRSGLRGGAHSARAADRAARDEPAVRPAAEPTLSSRRLSDHRAGNRHLWGGAASGATNWSLSILGTLDDRVGDVPTSRMVAPLRLRPTSTAAEDFCCSRPADQEAGGGADQEASGLRPVRYSRYPPSGARFFGQTIHNNYQAFADPNASGGDLGRASRRSGIDLLRGSLIAGQYERAGLYGAYGDVHADVNGLVTNPAATAYVLTHTGSMNLQLLVGGRLLDAYRARRLVSRRRAARDLVLRLGQHPRREA